jgi:Ion channel
MSSVLELRLPPVKNIRTDLRRNSATILAISGLLLLYVATSGALYSLAEGKSFTLALYFTVINVTTVGFGDITPTTSWGRVIAAVNSLAGLVLFGFLVAAITMALQPSSESAREASEFDQEADNAVHTKKVDDAARRFDQWMKHFNHGDKSVAESFQSFIYCDPCIVEYGISYEEYVQLAHVVKQMGYSIEWMIERDTFHFLVKKAKMQAENRYRYTGHFW